MRRGVYSEAVVSEEQTWREGRLTRVHDGGGRREETELLIETEDGMVVWPDGSHGTICALLLATD